MSLFSHYEPCPRCVGNGKDSRGDNLAVYRDGSSHCFSCSYHRHAKGSYQWAKTNTLKENNGTKSLLPFDYTDEIPTHAWRWLLQWGIPFSSWKPIVGYSPYDERLVIRVESEGLLRFSIGRHTPSDDNVWKHDRPTGNHVRRRKWYVWGDSHRHAHLLGESKETVVLVEDIISAIKVQHAGYSAIPLFGTTIYPCHLYYLLSFPGDVVLWLDKDQEMESRSKAIWLESIVGKLVKVVSTVKDPKGLSFNEINEVLNV